MSQLDRIEEKLDRLLKQAIDQPEENVDDEVWGNANGAFSPPGFPNGKWWPDHTKGSMHAQQFFEDHVNAFMGTSTPEPVPLDQIYPYGPKCGTPAEYRRDVEFASRYRGTPQPLD